MRRSRAAPSHELFLLLLLFDHITQRRLHSALYILSPSIGLVGRIPKERESRHGEGETQGKELSPSFARRGVEERGVGFLVVFSSPYALPFYTFVIVALQNSTAAII